LLKIEEDGKSWLRRLKLYKGVVEPYKKKKKISSPLTLMTIFALLYGSSDLYVRPEDGLTGRGRNM